VIERDIESNREGRRRREIDKQSERGRGKDGWTTV